jgi:uncharacterized protein (TIGR03118 family)
VALAAAIGLVARGFGASAGTYAQRPLVSNIGLKAPYHDPTLVNTWGLAASPTGPWWTTNEARGTSSLYAGDGRKQLLTVAVEGGPTGIAYYGGDAFPVRGGGHADPARFVYACEDGRIRAWTPTVPDNWSAKAEIVVDDTGEGAIFRGVAFARGRLYATDFHNDRVNIYDGNWQRVKVDGAFDDPDISPWYAPDGIAAFGDHIFVTYVFRAAVDGNDAPEGGYVDEFDLQGRLVSRIAKAGLFEPWGLAMAPKSFGRYGGDLLVASFGNGHIDAFKRDGSAWKHDGVLEGSNGKPLDVNGVWGIAFGNGGQAGPRNTLFAAAGPHLWRGASELQVRGLISAIEPS